MKILISIFAIYSLAFLIKNSDGPWGLMAKLRNTLMSNKYVGVFFYKLLECYHCVGTHSGWIIYLLQMENFFLREMILWAFAGGAISLLFDAVLTRLSLPNQ